MLMPTSTSTALEIRHRDANAIESSAMERRARAEFQEMPGLSLTVPQAARLFGLTTRESEEMLRGLVEDGFLLCDRRATYRRRGCSR